MFWTELICLSLLAICMDSFWWKLELSWFVITGHLLHICILRLQNQNE